MERPNSLRKASRKMPFSCEAQGATENGEQINFAATVRRKSWYLLWRILQIIFLKGLQS